MTKRLLYLFLAMIFIIGCAAKEEEPEEEPPPPPPPPPTPQEIAAKIVNDLGLDGPLPESSAKVNPNNAKKLLNIASTQNKQLSATEDGKKALQIVNRKLDSRIRACANNEAWAHTLMYTEMHNAFVPDSAKFLAERNRAIAELKKPEVTLKGIINDAATGRQIAYLEMYLPLTKETVTENMRLGDTLHGLKFTEVIGNNQGVVFNYIETDDTFEVMTKAASK